MSRKRLRTDPLEANESLRRDFMMDVSRFKADQFVWLDETSIDNRTLYRRYGRSVSGLRAVKRASATRGKRYSVCGTLFCVL